MSTGAEIVGREKEFGTLEVGKLSGPGLLLRGFSGRLVPRGLDAISGCTEPHAQVR
jgi:hypothetical protein